MLAGTAGGSKGGGGRVRLLDVDTGRLSGLKIFSMSQFTVCEFT